MRDYKVQIIIDKGDYDALLKVEKAFNDLDNGIPVLRAGYYYDKMMAFIGDDEVMTELIRIAGHNEREIARLEESNIKLAEENEKLKNKWSWI